MIETADGVANEAFAYAPWIPLDEIQTVMARMQGNGYRPTRLRPFQTQDGLFASLLWARDSRGSKWAYDLDEEETTELAAKYCADGFLPCDVAGYQSGDGSQRFAVLWEARRDKGEQREFYVGKPATESGSLQKAFASRGFRAFTQHFQSVDNAASEDASVLTQYDLGIRRRTR